MKRIFLSLSLAALSFSSLRAQTIVALTSDGKLLEMTSTTPGTVSTPVSITGIASGQMIAGIDYRPNTGQLYALGYNAAATTNNSQLYTVNKTTGVATAIGAVMTLDLGSGSIGVDFNPTVDRIRVVGANRKNYRLHPVTGAIAATDVDLAYAAGDANEGQIPEIGACAYTNSYIGSEATTLYDCDQKINVLATQIPPNNGTLNTIGSLGISISTSNPSIGMDIYFDPAAKTNIAYLNANTTGGTGDNLYTINLATGATTLVGAIGNGMMDIKEIAVEIDRNIPATYTGQLVYGLTKNNSNLIKFSTGNPELIRELLPITGLTAGQTIVGMDVRPLDLGLYALGYDAMTRAYQLYSINTATGAATAINSTPGTIHLGMGEKISFDFNPTVDRIRVVSTNDSNYRLNPITGAIGATDTSLAFNTSDANAGENPFVSSLAYTNSYRGTTSTSLFGIDDSLNIFCSIAPPNQGTVNTLASNVVAFNLADLTNDLDFFYDSTSSSNMGYLSANTGSSMNDDLYMVTTAGVATRINSIGMGVQVSDIAVQLTFTNSMALSVNEIAKQQLASVYPNPASTTLNVSFTEVMEMGGNLVVTDVAGRIVISKQVAKGSNGTMVNIAGLTNGLYLINLNGGKTGAVKFIKN